MILRFLPLLLAALFLTGCGDPKQGPKEAAAEFFAKCASGKIDEAYKSASKIFQLERTDKYFEARVRDLGLEVASPDEARQMLGMPALKDRAAKAA